MKLIVFFALLICVSHLVFAYGLDLDHVTTRDCDEHAFLAYLLAADKVGMLFPELASTPRLLQSFPLHLQLMQAGVFQPREAYASLLAYPLHALALRCTDSYLAMKLVPAIHYAIVYVCWAIFISRCFSRSVLLIASCWFLFCPFNLRFTLLYHMGSQDISLLFTSLVFFWLATIWRMRPFPALTGAAFCAGVGLAACAKNLVDWLALAGLVLLLLARHRLSWRQALVACLASCVGYLLLPLGFATIGLPPHAQFIDYENTNYVGYATTPSAFLRNNRTLPEELRKLFVFQNDLSPAALSTWDWLPLLLLAAALAVFAQHLARRRAFWHLPRHALRLFLLLHLCVFAVIYLAGPIRVSFIHVISTYTSYRYFASTYPIFFIVLAWGMASAARRLRGNFRLACLVLLFGLIFWHPVTATIFRLSITNRVVTIFDFRAVQFAPLGWLLARTAPTLPPAELESRLVMLAERETDLFCISRDYFRYWLYASRRTDQELRERFQSLRHTLSKAGFCAALGIHAIERRRQPQYGGTHDADKIANQFAYDDFLQHCDTASIAEFWRGYGFGDTAHGPVPRNPHSVFAFARELAEPQRTWYLEGVGETYFMSNDVTSLRYLHDEFSFDIPARAPLLTAGYPPSHHAALRSGARRALMHLLRDPGRLDSLLPPSTPANGSG